MSVLLFYLQLVDGFSQLPSFSDLGVVQISESGDLILHTIGAADDFVESVFVVKSSVILERSGWRCRRRIGHESLIERFGGVGEEDLVVVLGNDGSSLFR